MRLSLLLALSLPVVALADPAISIRYDDLNLENAAGVSALRKRIQSAAERVCEGYHSRDLGSTLKRDQCVREASERALAQVDWTASQEPL